MQSNLKMADKLVESLAETVSTLLANTVGNNDGDASIKAEAQRNVRAIIQNAVSKLDIVSREEFDAQVAVLHRSREKIDELEQQLKELSALVKQP